MRILFLSTTFPDADSPARGTYNSALCLALRQQKHQVRVIAPRFFTEVYRPFRGRRTYRTPDSLVERDIAVDYPTYWYTPRLLQHRYGEQMWWSVRKSVETAVRKFQPDAILSYWAHPDGEVGVRAAELAGVPSAVIVGGTDVLILPRHPKRGRSVRDVLTRSDAVITVSDGLRQAVCQLGIDSDRVQTIYQGIDEERFHTRRTRAQSRKVLGLTDDFAHLVWVGRMVPIKSLQTLLTAASLLRERGVKFKLHLLGDGPEKAPMQRMSARLGLDSYVQFHGAVGHDRIPDWDRAADLCVLSSDSEGLPNVLRESLACGTPFVATDVGSLREIARPEFSRLVPPGAPQAFADAVQSLLNPESREAAAVYQPRTWGDCARETAQLLERLRDRRLTELSTQVAVRSAQHVNREFIDANFLYSSTVPQ